MTIFFFCSILPICKKYLQNIWLYKINSLHLGTLKKANMKTADLIPGKRYNIDLAGTTGEFVRFDTAADPLFKDLTGDLSNIYTRYPDGTVGFESYPNEEGEYTEA